MRRINDALDTMSAWQAAFASGVVTFASMTSLFVVSDEAEPVRGGLICGVGVAAIGAIGRRVAERRRNRKP
jgi:hypothetical protein